MSTRLVRVASSATWVACALSCSNPPAAAPHSAERVSHTAPLPSTPRVATHSEPAEAPIDVNAEPWHDQSEPPLVAAERIPDRGEKISVLDVTPRRLGGEARPGFGYALALIRRVRFEVKSKRWKEELRTRCRDSHGFGHSKALVTDENDRIRALTEAGGSDDSAGTSSLFYDENERLRCLFISYGHYSGTSTEQLVAFDARGAALGCDYLVLKRGASMWNLCESPRTTSTT
jgi:hypothetical protein